MSSADARAQREPAGSRWRVKGLLRVVGARPRREGILYREALALGLDQDDTWLDKTWRPSEIELVQQPGRR